MKKVNNKKSKKEIGNNKKGNINNLIKLICNAVGLAMGIGVIVLFIMKKLNTTDAIIMLGIGLFCVSFPSMMKRN